MMIKLAAILLVATSTSASIIEGAWPDSAAGSSVASAPEASEAQMADSNAAAASAVMADNHDASLDNHDDSIDNHDKAVADNHDASLDNHDAPLVDAEGAESSRVVMEGLESDRITAEIEDLQQKLGDLQNSIDKALQEEGSPGSRRRRSASDEPRRHRRHPSVDAMSGQLDHLIKTIRSLQSFFGSKIGDSDLAKDNVVDEDVEQEVRPDGHREERRRRLQAYQEDKAKRSTPSLSVKDLE